MSEFNEIFISSGPVNRDSLIAGFVKDAENDKYNREDDTCPVRLGNGNNHDMLIAVSGETGTNTTQDASHG